jgi:PhnB protein
MARAASPIPQGMHTITPHLVIRDAARAIDFYKKAFGAQEVGRSKTPDGRIMHATLKIGDSLLFLNDEFPEYGQATSPQTIGGTPVTINLYVEDADAVFNRAVDAGAEVSMPIADQFWGDRYGTLRDPFGHSWSVATHKEDLTPEEIRARSDAYFASAPQH